MIAALPLVFALFPLGVGSQPGTPVCTTTWTFNGDGNWDTAANWDHGLPTTGSTVCIPAHTVTYDHATTNVASIQSVGTLAITNGTLQTTDLSEDSSIASLVQSGGILGGPSTVVLTGASTWSGGTMTGSGTTRLAGGGTLSLSGNVFLSQFRRLDLHGTATWSAGTISAPGTTTSVLVNQGGVLDVTADLNLQGAGTLDVAAGGTLRKSAGTGTSTIQPRSTSEGLIESLSGTISFPGSLKNGGTLSTAASARATAPFENSGVIRGSGTIQGNVASGAEVSPGLSTGALTVQGSYEQQPQARLRVEISSASLYDTLAATSPATLDGTLTIESAPGEGTVIDVAIPASNS